MRTIELLLLKLNADYMNVQKRSFDKKKLKAHRSK